MVKPLKKNSSNEEGGPSVLALTQGLLVSGGLNVILLTLFVGMMIKETPPLAFASFRESTTISSRGPLRPSTLAFLEVLSSKKFEEIIPYLSSEEPLEEGVTKRDIALSWIVAAHHFDLRKALFGLSKPISDRIVRVKVQGKMWELRLFPRLPLKHLESISRFIEKEKWPFDAEGLYDKLLEGVREPSLIEAFLWTKEYLLIERLLKEGGLDPRPDEIVNRLLKNSWTLEMWRFPQVDKLYPLFQLQATNVKPPAAVSSKPKQIIASAPPVIPPIPPVASKPSKTYVIQEGDSLWKISKKEGVSVDAIKSKNPSLGNILKPGTKIELP